VCTVLARVGTAIAVAVAVAACSRGHASDRPAIHRAFYYWRTTFALSPTERAALTAARTLYVRTFDVGWSTALGQPELLGPLTVREPAPAGVAVVPVVYLKNEVFQKLTADRLEAFARQTWDEVGHRMAALGATPRELQLDCDWSLSTRERYFAYLIQLRGIAGVPLSATIRLHQVKFREKTGVPPVERGALMFYNMGEFRPEAGKRAIFDAHAAARYVERLDSYPLPLDLALPIYSWTVQVRDERVVALLQRVDPDELAGVEFLRPDGDRFAATRNGFLHGALLREDDRLKIERMAPADTLAAAALAAEHLRRAARTVVLFDLSERNLARYGNDELDRIFEALR
jgi:hypothetical protein